MLVEWGALLTRQTTKDPSLWAEHGTDLTISVARILERCLSSTNRAGLRNSALAALRRVIREIVVDDERQQAFIKTTVAQLTTNKQSLGSNAAVFLGLLAGTCARFAKAALETQRPNILSFYIREIIGARAVVPSHVNIAFRPFITNYITADDLQTRIIPALEKALLRAPEVVLNNLIPSLMGALPSHIDISSALVDHLLKPLLSSSKSQNIFNRSGAITALSSIIGRCHDKGALCNIANEIVSPLASSKLATADHRQVYADMASSLPYIKSRSPSLCAHLANVASKEPNENALDAEVMALAHQIALLIMSGDSDDNTSLAPIAKVFEKGLSDKRPGVIKVWAAGFGAMVLQCQYQSRGLNVLVNGFSASMMKLVDQFNEVVQNPASAVQSGSVVAAYVALYSQSLFSKHADEKTIKERVKKAKILEQSLLCTPKPSFLLNHRFYTRITDSGELIWFLRALGSCIDHLTDTEAMNMTNSMLCFALFYCATSTTVKPVVRQSALQTLEKAYKSRPALVGLLVIRSLWQWCCSIQRDEQDTAAAASKSGSRWLSGIVQMIFTYSDTGPQELINGNGDEILTRQLIDMLVLAQPKMIQNLRWIDLCLKVGKDPAELVQSKPTQCLARIDFCISDAELQGSAGSLNGAAYDAAAELAFVAPEAMTLLLTERIVKYLPVKDITRYGALEVAITDASDDKVFVDILNAKTNVSLDKNTRDYETIKWEQEVRGQAAKKKAQEKKYTADEKAKIEKQLSKESTIRTEVNGLRKTLGRGAGFIHALANGPPTDARIWLGPSLKCLIEAIEAGAGHIVGGLLADAYLACSNLISPRLTSLRKFVGIGTLRAIGTDGLPLNVLEEPLADLVTRLLYRFRLLSEQRPFETISLLYMIPLVTQVLRKQGIGSTKQEEIEEQVTLALDFLSFHTDSFSDSALPRTEILTLLYDCMQKYPQHYKIIRDILHEICSSLASNMTTPELSILLRSTIAPKADVRYAFLQAIHDHLDLTDFDFSEEIWLAVHDEDEENSILGRAIWQENALDVEARDVQKIRPYLSSQSWQLRRGAARAIASGIAQHNSEFKGLLDQLEKDYIELAKPRMPERDHFGMIKKMSLADPWEARSGIALTFREMVHGFVGNDLLPFMRFMIESSAVGDANATVRGQMSQAAVSLIALKGAERVEDLMELFEHTLSASDKSSAASDLVSEAVIVLYGVLTQHLQSEDQRIPKVVRRLLETLKTPSESVQYAVAECLPPLVRNSQANSPEYIQHVLDDLLHAKQYASRRGAAYGLAGIVSGKGVASLKEFRILSSLKGALENKKEQIGRQGALFAYELLSTLLGRVFEPFIIQIVPLLLLGFGDSSADVREACLDASKACFASLSSYGVKAILPTLLEGLEESQWRSKKGACDLLGAMAYLDPQQLALSLPDIIPPLTNVLNDSHKEVRASAKRSLQRFGEVISNPEVKGLVDILLKALSDPTKYTDDALDALIKVSFVHYLDSPSLALIVRILERGLSDRSATKRKSSQIIGSLAHLTERKDVTSHLPILVSGLKMAVVDPVPATRATASKALGSLVEKLGEEALPDLIPNLMSTLRADTGAGDRLGSAQALSEVLAGLGTSRLEETLPTILQNVSSSRPTTREGFMSLFIYLPACFGNSFSVYLSKVIPPILAGLADDIESIRETSLRAGRLLVKNFATKAIDLLLPELDRGLGDDSHRIRLSSVELVGDLLFNLTGISGKTEEDEEDFKAPEAGISLLEVLGEVKRNKILSSLYICRCDTSGLVRTAAINVWKALVSTPRTLKEIIPTLAPLLIRRLASSNPEQKAIAGTALGELIRKAGDGVLATLLPTLQDGLYASTDADHRQGICIALREIISSASEETLEDYETTLIDVVRIALTDSDLEVREAAAEAFDSLQKTFGKRAVDQVLPHLLNLLRSDDEANTALAALLTLLTDNTRSNVILPNLIPTFLEAPITSFNAKALASLSKVAGPALNRRLPVIFNSLINEEVISTSSETRADLAASFDAILVSVDEYDGLNTTMSVMLALVKHNDHRIRVAANRHMGHFIAKSPVDFSRYHPDLVRVLLISFDDSDIDVVKAAWEALSELTRRLKKEELEVLVAPTRQVLQQVGVAGANLAGFELPKGIGAILPIFLQGLLNGTTEQRIQAALAISDVIDRTSADALKLFVTQITGPLIRVISERSVDVKCRIYPQHIYRSIHTDSVSGAILLTLNNLLEKIPTSLKPFLPQLQRTFAKSLADTTSETLRSRAAKALGTLITLTPRIDPLIAELVGGSKTLDPGVRNAMLKALYEVISKAGQNMSEASRNLVLGMIDGEAGTNDEAMTISLAQLLGALIKALPSDAATSLVKQRVLPSHQTMSSALNLNSVLLSSPESLLPVFQDETAACICKGMRNTNMFISDNSILAAGKYLLAENFPPGPGSTDIIVQAIAEAMQQGKPVDTRRLALVVVRTVCRQRESLLRGSRRLLAPIVFTGVRDPVIPVKLAAEAAFLAMFLVVDREDEIFNEFMSGPGARLDPPIKKSMQDYFKRVAMRLGKQARERKEAEGGQGALGLSSDEVEDEREVWSVGKVDLGENTFDQ